MDKHSIQADLKNNVAEIIFRKLDGTIRTMRATLQQKYLPIREEENRTEHDFDHEVDQKPNVVAVWDIDNKGWRSFHIDKVISIQMIHVV